MGFRGCVRTGRETAGPSTSLRSGLTWERHRRGTHVFLNQSAAVEEVSASCRGFCFDTHTAGATENYSPGYTCNPTLFR